MSNTYYLKEAIRGALYSNTLNEASPAVINRLLEMMKAEGEKLIQGFDAIKKNGENVKFQIVNTGSNQSLRLVINLYAGWTKKSVEEINAAYRKFVERFEKMLETKTGKMHPMFKENNFRWNRGLDQPMGNTIDMEVVNLGDFAIRWDREDRKNEEAFRALGDIKKNLETFIYYSTEGKGIGAGFVGRGLAGRHDAEVMKEYSNIYKQVKNLIPKVEKAILDVKDRFGDKVNYW